MGLGRTRCLTYNTTGDQPVRHLLCGRVTLQEAGQVGAAASCHVDVRGCGSVEEAPRWKL